MAFVPHTPHEIKEMLTVCGVASMDELFCEIPTHLRCGELALPDALSEMDVSRLLNQKASQNKTLCSFLGAGAYEHFIPAAVWQIASRGEWMTAYTPYQAEASQGTLQLLYEFQSMMVRLTGMEVSNASLYDGASALAEAVLMSVRLSKAHQTCILVPAHLHPHYRETLDTVIKHLDVELKTLPFDPQTGCLNVDQVLQQDLSAVAACIVPWPNFFGGIEQVDALTDGLHAAGVLVIAQVNPMALALLKAPGAWGQTGADIVVGEGQPLGVPLAFGGPYFGFMTTRQSFIRQMPGRIVGRTVDLDGKPGYTLTLQAREQHIRRAKATSNICTNQGLLVTAATIYMSLMGAEGLYRVALKSHQNMQLLKERLATVCGLTAHFEGASFHEMVTSLPCRSAWFIERMAERGFLAGLALDAYPSLGVAQGVLLNVTETKSTDEVEAFVLAAREVLALAKTPKQGV